MHVWFVDDAIENRVTWLESFPPDVTESCELRAFASVPELFMVLDEGERPDVMFVDYFLGRHVGAEVVERFLADDETPPLLIAHSSMPRLNEGMVRLGAHLAMEKLKDVPRTPSIVQRIRSMADLESLIAKHRPVRR